MKRTPEQVIWDFVQGWLRKAAGDLQAAERLLDFHQDDYFTAAFHAQQAAEKFLKAFLVRHQIPFPKPHDIQDLLRLAARADSTLERELASAAMVTPFGVEIHFSMESFRTEKNGDIWINIDADSKLPTLFGIKPSYQFCKRPDGSVRY